MSEEGEGLGEAGSREAGTAFALSVCIDNVFKAVHVVLRSIGNFHVAHIGITVDNY